jgi:hypothetical protein
MQRHRSVVAVLARIPLMIGGLFAVVVGIGAYLGTAQVAASTPQAPRRTVTLRIGDVAVLGRIQCIAISESRARPMTPGAYYMRCLKRPRSGAHYVVDNFGDGAVVWRVGEATPLYTTPPHEAVSRGKGATRKAIKWVRMPRPTSIRPGRACAPSRAFIGTCTRRSAVALMPR